MAQGNSQRVVDLAIMRAFHISTSSLKLVLLLPRNFETFSPKMGLAEALTRPSEAFDMERSLHGQVIRSLSYYCY
ncbi:hypothetical protein ARMSODRAFT_606626 [Armillaria solidipes]|uniref:Uncharacterized protein n=1 Tax=Armillaria solidipes TaxID=1076256 RepID=A0A2H3BGX2_9AGAR|nr:hypothetical protein ARMSODRAFT_606626 [Armillaria solidipes]